MSSFPPGPPPLPPPPPPRPSGGFLLGLLVTLGPCVVLVGIAFTQIDAHEKVATSLIIGAGIIQFFWVIPMFRNAKRTNNERMKIGLIVGASLAFLFCATCGGLLAALSGANFH